MKIKRSDFLKLMSVTAASAVLAGCGSSVVEQAAQSTANSQASSGPAPAAELDLSENIALKINYAAGNKSRTITYNQESPLNLPDGTNVTAGMLKPVWSHLKQVLNVTITDVTTQDQKATEMIDTASTTNFAEANIFGGNSIADDLMYYGTEDKFVNLSQMMDQGYLPNFQNYLDENPDVRRAITAYDGNIYHIPYIAELNNFARSFCARQSWVVMLLDVDDAAYDTDTELTCYYKGFYAGANARYGANGGSVSPMEGVTITKKTDQNIVELQNALSVKNGETLTRTFVQYVLAQEDVAADVDRPDHHRAQAHARAFADPHVAGAVVDHGEIFDLGIPFEDEAMPREDVGAGIPRYSGTPPRRVQQGTQQPEPPPRPRPLGRGQKPQREASEPGILFDSFDHYSGVFLQIYGIYGMSCS